MAAPGVWIGGPAARTLLPVLLDAGGSQAGETMLVDRGLPGEEFLHGEGIAVAGLVQRQEATAYRGDDLRLTADYPAAGARWGQIGNGQRTTVRPDDIFHPRPMGFRHRNTHSQRNATTNDCKRAYMQALKNW